MTANPKIEEIKKRQSLAPDGPISIERHEGIHNDSFRHEVIHWGKNNKRGGFVAFYEDNFDEPLRAKFAAEQYAHAKEDIALLLKEREILRGALDALRDKYADAYAEAEKKWPEAAGLLAW